VGRSEYRGKEVDWVPHPRGIGVVTDKSLTLTVLSMKMLKRIVKEGR
jgi:hypothetical protein